MSMYTRLIVRSGAGPPLAAASGLPLRIDGDRMQLIVVHHILQGGSSVPSLKLVLWNLVNTSAAPGYPIGSVPRMRSIAGPSMPSLGSRICSRHTSGPSRWQWVVVRRYCYLHNIFERGRWKAR